MLGRSFMTVGSMILKSGGARRMLLSTSVARLQQNPNESTTDADIERLFNQHQQDHQSMNMDQSGIQHDDFEEADMQDDYGPPQSPQQQQYGGNNQRAYQDQEQQPRRFVNRGINRVELLGGVGSPPTVKMTAQGVPFASFNLYTNVDRKLPSGQIISNTEVHNIICFGGMAKYVERAIDRGTRIYMTGRLHYTGGQLAADGSRIPRICSINLETLYPLARGGGAGSGFGGARPDGGNNNAMM